ncbi:uncharacterized protein [Littorina saxatilis]|uniref:uncharacterized protein n=1 Tax=Littorina saxatilis TaxID=31220 RepID=UPI0038B44133
MHLQLATTKFSFSSCFQSGVKVGNNVFPLLPPAKKKRDLIPDLAVFKGLEEFVRNTPESKGSSVETLALYLTGTCKTDVDKLRAIFCWIAENIAYDTESAFGISGSKSKSKSDAASILQSGKAVCQGYAELFAEMCKVADIPCVIVSGFSKGYGYDPEDVFSPDTKTSHAWNLVLVEGEWRPLDNTWSAGHIDDTKTFVREFDEHWFLTDPEEFVPRHFPFMNKNLEASSKYQLLRQPLTIEEFSASAAPKSLAYDLGLQLITHKHQIIEVDCDVTIKLKATRQPLGTVKVTLQKRESQEDVKGSLLASLSDDGTCSVYVRPPDVATYELTFFGRGQGEQSEGATLQLLVSYVIRCRKTHPNKEPFPEKSGPWGLKLPVALECGLNKIEDAPFEYNAKNGEVNVPLSLIRYTKLSANLKQARNMDEDLGEFDVIDYTEEGATITARLPKPGYYMLTVFASHPDKSKHVADFLLYTDIECPDLEPYPGKSVILGLKNPAATTYGLEPSKDTSFNHRVKDGHIKFALPFSRYIELTAKLKHSRNMDASLGEFVVIEYTEEGATITARLTNPGYYLLTVFAGLPEDADLGQVANFLLYADTGCPDQEPYPGKSVILGLKNPAATTYGLEPSKDTSFNHRVKDGHIKFALPFSRYIELTAKLKHSRNMDASLGEFVVIEYTEEGATITARLTNPGYYLLTVFAGLPEDKNLEQVADFLLYADTGCPDQEPYPGKSVILGLINPTAAECGIKPRKGMPFSLRAQEGEVSTVLPLGHFTELNTTLVHARNMEKDLKEFTIVEFTEDSADISARLPNPGYYKLKVFAKHPQDTNTHKLSHVASFLLYADTEYGKCKPFPHAYDTRLRRGAKLLKPLVGEVPSGTATLFRLHAPTLAKVRVNDTEMEMNNEGVWEAEMTPRKDKEKVRIYGAADKNAEDSDRLYSFTVY